MSLQYITRAEDLVTVSPGRHLVDAHATLWLRTPSGWADATYRHRTSQALLNRRGPVYLLPEGFTGGLNLDDLSDAEPGDYVLDPFGHRWGKSTAGRWLLDEVDDPRGISKKSEDLLAVYSPLLPAPRPSETYVRPVSAMEAAARQEEARPVIGPDHRHGGKVPAAITLTITQEETNGDGADDGHLHLRLDRRARGHMRRHI